MVAGRDPLVMHSGAQKASIVMLALGAERAARLLALLDRGELLELSRTMAALGHVEAGVVDRLLVEFRARLASGGVVGGLAATESLLARSLGSDQAGPILEAIRGPAARSIWAELAAVDDSVLAPYLANEHPQTVAVILARLEAEQAARLLARLPEDLAADVVLRVLRLDPLGDEVVADVERAIAEDLGASLGRAAGDRDGHAAMAAVFNQLDRATETRLMQALEQVNKEAADRVRGLMFTFEDLARLDPAGVQTLIRQAGNDRLALALKAASEPLRELFFANMSERSAKMLREEMQARGPVRLRDVEEAQQFLVNLAKELAASGQLTLSGPQAEELVY